MTFLANNLERERNIDGILLEICSACVCCPEQSINIWFLSDTVRLCANDHRQISVCHVFFAKMACFSR
jgi:hypothetical protein